MVLIKFKTILVLIITFVSIDSLDVPNLTRGHAEIGYYPFMDMENCGYINPLHRPQDKIVAGTPALEGEFPWMASLHYQNISDSPINDSFICGGVLINTDWVLTARHCVENLDKSQLKIYLGSVDKYEYYYMYFPTAIIWHPSADLGLIRLNTPAYPVLIGLHFVINTICLPKDYLLNNVNEEAVISGFGGTDQQNQNKSKTLLKTVLTIDPYFDCLDLNMTLREICATETEHMTCFGDSGSALLQFDGKRAVIIGTVLGGQSYTNEICGPGLLEFKRVSFYIDWLVSHLDTKPKTTVKPFLKLPKEPNPQPVSEKESDDNFIEDIPIPSNCQPILLLTFILFISHMILFL